MTAIYIDIETVPDMRAGARESFLESVRNDFKAPADLTKERAAAELGMTDPQEIKLTSKDTMLSRWVDRFRDEKAGEVADAAWRKTSFDATQGQICCIGYAFDNGFANSCVGDEKDILKNFFSALAFEFNAHRRPVFIGHNHVAFDLPFIFRRAVILGVEPPAWMPRLPKPWDESVFDTMVQWAGHGNRISMDNLCAALGIPGKDGMDGSQVCDYYLDGRIEEIAEYCKGDVSRTRQIHRRLAFIKDESVAPWLLEDVPA